ncbi:MAG: cupin domain-containing protein [Candidatus Aenigmatarchaeota archaeon]
MKLKVNEDERGWLAEVFRDEFAKGQVYAFTIKPGKIRGRHYHKKKMEWFCVLQGSCTVEIDGRKHKMNAFDKVYIQPNSYHEIKNTGKELLLVVTYSSEKYNPDCPDTYGPVRSPGD